MAVCPIPGRWRQRALQQPKIRPALLVEDNRLTIEDHRGWTERRGSLGNRRKAMRPVMATSGDDPDAGRFDMNREPISVPFNLVGPVVALGWSGFRESQAGLDPLGHRVEEKLWLIRVALADPSACSGARSFARSGCASLTGRLLIGAFHQAELNKKTALNLVTKRAIPVKRLDAWRTNEPHLSGTSLAGTVGPGSRTCVRRYAEPPAAVLYPQMT